MGNQTTYLGVQINVELFFKKQQKKTHGFLESPRTYDHVNLVYVYLLLQLHQKGGKKILLPLQFFSECIMALSIN